MNQNHLVNQHENLNKEELVPIDLDDTKQEHQRFFNTVYSQFREIDRLKHPQRGPAGAILTVDDNTNKMVLNTMKKQRKIDTQHMLITNSLQNMMRANNMQPSNNIVSMLDDRINIPNAIKQFITRMLGDILNKVLDFRLPLPLCKIIEGDKQITKEAANIEFEVCTTKKEVSFWKTTERTRQKLIGFFFSPDENRDEKTGFNQLCDKNNTLPYYKTKSTSK